jgi:hypothetical protein
MIHSNTEAVEVSHFSSEREVQQELVAKVQEIVEQAQESAEVSEARRANGVAEMEVNRLRGAHRELLGRSKKLREDSQSVAGRLESALIDGGELTATQLDNLVRLEADQRATMRAVERIVERLTPAAEMAHLEAAAALFLAQARELRRVADERIRHTARLMADAAQHEGEIVFDPRKTVSGLLTLHAEELERRAADHLRWADEKRRQHERLLEGIR